MTFEWPSLVNSLPFPFPELHKISPEMFNVKSTCSRTLSWLTCLALRSRVDCFSMNQRNSVCPRPSVYICALLPPIHWAAWNFAKVRCWQLSLGVIFCVNTELSKKCHKPETEDLEIFSRKIILLYWNVWWIGLRKTILLLD